MDFHKKKEYFFNKLLIPMCPLSRKALRAFYYQFSTKILLRLLKGH